MSQLAPATALPGLRPSICSSWAPVGTSSHRRGFASSAAIAPARPHGHCEQYDQAADLRKKRDAGDTRHGYVLRRDRHEARGEPTGKPRCGFGLRISHGHGRQMPEVRGFFCSRSLCAGSSSCLTGTSVVMPSWIKQRLCRFGALKRPPTFGCRKRSGRKSICHRQSS
jgi:hypothetical protein